MTGEKILYDYAISWLGRWYRWGGDDPGGIDCSGLCIEILTAMGAWPPGKDARAIDLYRHFATRADRGRLGLGALCFYGKSLDAISHVGFALDRHFILEAGGGGASTVNAEIAAKQNAMVRVRPVLHRADFLEALMPRYKYLSG